jgi:hypothetical protein
MLEIQNIVPGKSYACKFKPNGLTTTDSIGIIILRDKEKQLVKIKDAETSEIHVLAYKDVWDIDEVEWVES